MKISLKKCYLLIAMTIVAVTGMVFSAVPAFAGTPPAPTHTDNMVVGGQYNPGTQGTEMDIMINNGAALPGWCVNENVDIYVGTQYPADLYAYLDYFGESYPANIGLLPSAIINNTYTQTTINWPAVAYILNNKAAGASSMDIQKAMWCFSDNDSSGLSTNTQTMVDAAKAYLSANNGVYIPGPGQLEPIICFAIGSSPLQIIFYEYTIPYPPIAINPTSLPGTTVNTAYSQSLSAAGGNGNYTWSITSGALPAGLTLSGNVISGTPTATGTFNFMIGVTDSAGDTNTQALSIIVSAPSWDINGDGVCNYQDLVALGNFWGDTGTVGWVPEDINHDGVVNYLDLVQLGLHWGQAW
jgi:hypothetical protein